MSDYNKPPFNNLAFTFNDSGYSTPSFNDLDFKFNSRELHPSTAELQASINVMRLYQDSTYTYLKECKTIVVGFSSSGVQTLKLPCTYGGIRDLGGYIYSSPTFIDLAGSISIISNYLELQGFVRTTKQSYTDLTSAIRSNITNNTVDIIGQLTSWGYSNKNLHAYIRGLLGINIDKDLQAQLNPILPVDLKGLLNVIEIKDLPSYITGVYFKGNYDLKGIIQKTLFRNNLDLISYVHGWDCIDLLGTIQTIQYLDLSGIVQGGYYDIVADLHGSVLCVSPCDLSAYLKGWQVFDLHGILIPDKGNSLDLNAVVSTITPVNLNAKISAFKGVSSVKELPATIESFFAVDLNAYFNIVHPLDLSASINPKGKVLDLNAKIIPKIVYLRKVLRVSLLEHIDLKGLINVMCVTSSHTNLNAYVYPIMKADLKGFIIGWKGNTSDTLKDLNAIINVDNSTTLNGVALNYNLYYNDKFIKIPVKYKAYKPAITTRELTLLNTHTNYTDLTASLHGHLYSADLNAYIQSVDIASYRSIPDYIKLDTNEVFINLREGEFQWKRFVEIMFKTGSKEKIEYVYIESFNKVFKIEKTRHWTIWTSSRSYESDSILKYNDVRNKFIFKLTDYNSIDEAIRDYIDRVSDYRRKDLNATLTSLQAPHIDLKGTVIVNYKKGWFKNLKGFIFSKNNGYCLLNASCIPSLIKGELDLTGSIMGRCYEPPEGNQLLFSFDNSNYIPPDGVEVNLDWEPEDAEQFWK